MTGASPYSDQSEQWIRGAHQQVYEVDAYNPATPTATLTLSCKDAAITLISRSPKPGRYGVQRDQV